MEGLTFEQGGDLTLSCAPFPKLQTGLVQLIVVLTFHFVNLADVLLVLLVRFHWLLPDNNWVQGASLFGR